MTHPTLQAESPFGFLSEREKKEFLPESRQAFEVTAAWTSGLVSLVSSPQTGFSSASIR